MDEFGLVGLGRMGGGLAMQALDKGLRVVGASRGGARKELVDAGLVAVPELRGLREALHSPRAVFLYVPAGRAVDEILDQLGEALEPGDVVLDGGNSYWGDSIRRHARMRERGLHFVDLGTSGGVEGARHGACFMAGGERAAVALVEPLLEALAVEGGYVHAGPPGAGHFVKLVHNGIEFGMLQALGEGFQLLTRYHERLDVGPVLECWRRGSVIRSWLVDLLARAYAADPGLRKPGTHIEDTGEVNWLVADALNMEVPVPVIAQSVMQLFASRDEDQDWARAIVTMRHEFGGHPYGTDEAIAKERRTSRVGEIFRRG
ncbi:MAG TPA: decarboxylating 6-phosphogluconate dehydrogenase [Burkholderiales bacterium]|jgi:6-phosphogluconate dehydrogenase